MFRSVFVQNLLIEFFFDFSKNETRIIFHFDIFSLILNQSDTKKTTCFVFKSFAKYAANSVISQKRSSRQLLVTKSNELINKLKNYINRLIKTLAASSADEDEQKMLSLPDAEDDKYQCDTIFELQDGSFLFVCTFDQFLKLVENIIKKMNQKDFFVIDEDDDAQKNERLNSSKNEYSRWHSLDEDEVFRFVNFQSFKLDYWFKFSVILAAKFSIELVFVEIMKIIKNSLFSWETLKVFSRNKYLQLNSRLISVFIFETEKLQIYNIFEKYQALKLHRRESNGMNQIMKTIMTMKENQILKNYFEASFDKIYIDEVQDLRCLEIELLLNMIKDDRAFHFVEDTAQTISQDSHFCFQDIKVLFYDHFATEVLLSNQLCYENDESSLAVG